MDDIALGVALVSDGPLAGESYYESVIVTLSGDVYKINGCFRENIEALPLLNSAPRPEPLLESLKADEHEVEEKPWLVELLEDGI